jgi:hypothetical protein
VRGAPISASGIGQASALRCMEAEAYANRMLFTVENIMTEVTATMTPTPELLYIYSQIDYQLIRVGRNKPSLFPEMILQIRLRLTARVTAEDGETLVQQIHRRLEIEAPLFTSAWMVNGIKFEVMGQHRDEAIHPMACFTAHRGRQLCPFHKASSETSLTPSTGQAYFICSR